MAVSLPCSIVTAVLVRTQAQEIRRERESKTNITVMHRASLIFILFGWMLRAVGQNACACPCGAWRLRRVELAWRTQAQVKSSWAHQPAAAGETEKKLDRGELEVTQLLHTHFTKEKSACQSTLYFWHPLSFQSLNRVRPISILPWSYAQTHYRNQMTGWGFVCQLCSFRFTKCSSPKTSKLKIIVHCSLLYCVGGNLLILC